MPEVDVAQPLDYSTPSAAPAARRRTVADWAELLIPRAAGLVFLYAGITKAWDPTRTHRVLAFDGVPQSLVAPLTHLVWSAEVVLALILFIGIAKRGAVIATILVLFVYSVQLAYLLAAQNPPDCSCVQLHAKFASAKTALSLGLVRNAVMAAALEWVRLRIAGRASSLGRSG